MPLGSIPWKGQEEHAAQLEDINALASNLLYKVYRIEVLSCILQGLHTTKMWFLLKTSTSTRIQQQRNQAHIQHPEAT